MTAHIFYGVVAVLSFVIYTSATYALGRRQGDVEGYEEGHDDGVRAALTTAIDLAERGN